MLTDYYFWFAQPSSILNTYDWALGYLFAGLAVLGVLFWLVNKFFASHSVIKKLLGRYADAMFWIGVLGLIWFGLRYEAVPIFSKRAFAGAVLLIALAWLGWVTWYLVFGFRREKDDYDYMQVKNKYIK